MFTFSASFFSVSKFNFLTSFITRRVAPMPHLHTQDVSRQQHLCSGLIDVHNALEVVVPATQVPKGSQLPAIGSNNTSQLALSGTCAVQPTVNCVSPCCYRATVAANGTTRDVHLLRCPGRTATAATVTGGLLVACDRRLHACGMTGLSSAAAADGVHQPHWGCHWSDWLVTAHCSLIAY